jgi:hypothetical protein
LTSRHEPSGLTSGWRSLSAASLDDGGDVLGVQAVEVKMKAAGRFTLGRSG